MKRNKTTVDKELIDENFRYWVDEIPEKSLDLSMDKEELFFEFYDRLLAGIYKKEGSTKFSTKRLAKAFLKSYCEAGREEEISSFVDKEAWQIKYKEILPLINKFVNDFFTEQKVNITNGEELDKVLCSIAAEKLSKVFGSCIQVTNTNNKIVDTQFKLNITRNLLDMGYVEQAGFLIDGPQTQINEKYQKNILNMYINIANEFVNHHTGLKRKMEDEKYDLIWATVEKYLKNCESLMTDKTKQDETFKNVKQEVELYFQSKHDLRQHYTLTGIYGDYYNEVSSCIKRFKKGQNTPQDNEIVESFLTKTREINKALSYKDSKGRRYACNYFVYTTTPPMSMLYLICDFYKNIPNLKEEDIKMLLRTKSLIRAAFGNKMKNRQTVSSYHDSLRMFKYKTPDFDLTNQENFDKFAMKVKEKVDKYNLPNTELCVQIVGADMLKGKEPVKIDELKTGKSK